MGNVKLIAFHGDSTVKEKYLSRVRAHREADELKKGYYWQHGKGCAVGCTIHGSAHVATLYLKWLETGAPPAPANFERAAAEAARAAEAAAAVEAAEKASWESMRDKLLELIREAA